MFQKWRFFVAMFLYQLVSMEFLNIDLGPGRIAEGAPDIPADEDLSLPPRGTLGPAGSEGLGRRSWATWSWNICEKNRDGEKLRKDMEVS